MTDSTPPPISNILTIDVEDWYHLSGLQIRGRGTPRPDILARQLDRLLSLLAEHNCRATFFCLGSSLVNSPHLVQQIAAAGHEIATHGWGHEPIARIGTAAFQDDLKRSLDWLQELLGRPVNGYRAPAFSVGAGQLDEFYDICFEAGLAYDSSVFPIRGRRYGIPDARLEPHVVREGAGRRLVEIPLSATTWLGRQWPVAGGGYWRLMPVRLIVALVTRLNRERRPMVTYLHPYEFDAEPLSATTAAGRSLPSLRHQLRQNLNRGTMYRKLDTLLSTHRFGAVEDYLRDAGL
ncbi:MAG: polysaccharide deacetylase family protein [Phycisphaerae bacterium]|nr:polysaccharide deacetylase family protein [Phycisphaerae bacterium]